MAGGWGFTPDPCYNNTPTTATVIQAPDVPAAVAHTTE